MTEDQLQIFVDSVVHYFSYTNDPKVDVGTPYLVENTRPEAMDFTGIIGISGPQKGCVYFTAPTILLKHLLLALGERVVSKNNVIDVVGEVANTVSGNARREFGKNFLISVPVVVEGAPSSIHLPEALRSYVIPVAWKNYHASVVICLQ